MEHVLGMLAAGDSIETILAGYDWLERDDVLACLEYARVVVGREQAAPLGVSANQQSQPSSDVMTPEQRAAVLEMLHEIENLPQEPEPDDGLVGSRDHDEILYGRSRKVAPPQGPGQ